MSITLHILGNNLTPRKTTVTTQVAPLALSSDTAPSVVADAHASIIGGSVIDTNKQGQPYRTVRYIGYGNIPDFTTGFSILVRVVPRYTGNPSPATVGGLWTLSNFANLPWGYLTHNTNGTLNLRILNPLSSNMINITTTNTWSPTSGVASDIVCTWDGTTDANGVKVYIDGVLIFQGTASATSLFSVAKGTLYSEFQPCTAWPLGNDGEHDLNEAAIWNEPIDPTPSGLDLSGASRSDWVESTADSLGANVPSEDDVRDGVAYDDGAGNDFTGNLELPSVENVKLGIQYGTDGTELTGTLFVPGLVTGDTEWAPLEVQKAIYQILINDDEIIDLLGGDSDVDATTDKVFDFVPDNTVTPYIVVTVFDWQDRSNATFDGMQSEMQVSVWYEPGEGSNTSRGNKPVQLIQNRIDQLLNNTNLCIEGWNSLQLRRTLISIETQDDNVTKHGIQRFNLLIGRK